MPNELRLLPWAGQDGRPCYLSTSDRGGYVSRLADNTEAVQLDTAAELLQNASESFTDWDLDPDEMRRLTKELAGALRDVLRVATSRGHQVTASESHGV